MTALLGILLFSWLIHSVLYVPFIRTLYAWKLQRLEQKTRDAFDKRTPIFDKLPQHKAGTPVCGGLLIIVVTTILLPLFLLMMKYFWLPVTSVFPLISEIKVVLFAFLSFGLLGLVDDMKNICMEWIRGIFAPAPHKLIVEIILAVICLSGWSMS